MKLSIISMILFTFFIPLYAVGVKAGTIISNQATLSYEMENKSFLVTSNQISDIVDQLINLNLNWLDSSYVHVTKTPEQAILTFKITNTGNGKDSFELFIQNALGVDFEMQNCKTLMDYNDNAQFDKQDILKKSIALKADESSVVFLSCNIPNDNKIEHDHLFKVILKAVSKLGGSGIVGKVHESKGVQGVDAVDGVKGGIDTVEGVYILKTDDGLSLQKSATVTNQYGSNEPIVGAIIAYKIVLSVPKNKSAQNIIVSDEIPRLTEYVYGSLMLDGKRLSDLHDKDKGQFDALKNAILVEVDNLSYPDTKVITFNVRVK